MLDFNIVLTALLSLPIRSMPPLTTEPYAVALQGLLLRDLPSSDSVTELIETAEPVTFSDRLSEAGLWSADAVRIGSHASSWTQATYRLGDMDITDLTLGGRPFFHPDVAPLGAVSVASGALPVEMGSPGPVITVMPRSPGGVWRAVAEMSTSPSAQRAATTSQNPPPIAELGSWTHVNVTTDGPLLSRHVRALVSGSTTRSTYFERADPFPLPNQLESVYGRVVAGPSSTGQLDLQAAIERTTRPFPGRARFLDRHATEGDQSVNVQARWTHQSPLPWWLSAGVQSLRSAPSVRAGGLNGTVERLRDGPVPELVEPSPGNERRWTVTSGLADFRGSGSRQHVLRAGVILSRSTALAEPLGTGLLGETVAGLPARAWLYGYGGSDRTNETSVTVYGADHLALGAHVSLDAGLRVEMLRGSAAQGTSAVAWTTAAPRFAAAWRLGSRSVLLAAFGRYPHAVPLQALSYGDPAAPQGFVYRWTDANADGLVQPGEVGPLIAAVGPGSRNGTASVDPSLKRPYTDEVLAGAEWATSSGWVARFTGIARRERQLMAPVNAGVPVSSYLVTFVPDPGLDLRAPADHQLLPVYDRIPSTFGQDRYVLTNPPGLGASYEGVELTVARTGRDFQFLGGGTASRSSGSAANRGFLAGENDQGTLGELDTDPNAATFAAGRLFFERGYSAKMAAAYRGRGDVRLGAVARYQDGQNFARLVIAPDLSQGPEAIRAYPNGRSRFTYTLTVDARAEKGFMWGRVRLAAGLEAYNLLNMANETEEIVVTGPSFRASTARQPPRALRIVLRAQY